MMIHMERITPIVKFKTSILTLILCNYSDAYILVSSNITVAGAGVDIAAIVAKRNNKQAIFKTCAPCTECITEMLLCRCII